MKMKLSILIMVGCAYIYLFRTSFASSSELEIIFDFVKQLKRFSDDMTDFVSKIQAIFCPDQPICGSGGVHRDRSDILTTLPTDLNVSGTVVPLEELSEFMGVCCLPCSCENSCHEKENCCPTKVLQEDGSKSLTRSECIAPTPKSFSPYSRNSEAAGYMMTTQCFENDTGTNITTKCQHPSLNKFNELVPVTSLRTRLTYWNEYCVECNADADDLVPWNVKIAVEIDSEILTSLWSMNKNYKELIEMMSKSKALDFRYLPQIPNSGQQCIIKQYLRTCEHSSQPDYTHTPDWLFEACARFHNPAYIRNIKPSSFMNIFCFFCRPTSLPNIKGLNCKVFWTKKELPGQITALLDYKSVSALETETANDQPLKGDGTCACDEVFDNYKNLCRPLFCPVGEAWLRCRCVVILKTLAGVPVMIALEVTPKLQNAFSLDDQNMTPFLTALAKGLKGIADDHISAEVIALFANGDKYHLAIAIVSSDSGHDIKTALKPFMSYLDLSKHFEMRGAKMGFIIRLVEKVNIWVENDAAERKKVIRVQRVKKNTDNLTLIFPDTEIDATGYGRFRHFVALSELLYCTQIQLNETEFTENDGILTINTTKPPFSVSDYRKMSPTQARVCVSQYLRNSKPSHSTAVQLSYLVIMLYLSTVVILFRLR